MCRPLTRIAPQQHLPHLRPPCNRRECPPVNPDPHHRLSPSACLTTFSSSTHGRRSSVPHAHIVSRVASSRGEKSRHTVRCHRLAPGIQITDPEQQQASCGNRANWEVSKAEWCTSAGLDLRANSVDHRSVTILHRANCNETLTFVRQFLCFVVSGGERDWPDARFCCI